MSTFLRWFLRIWCFVDASLPYTSHDVGGRDLPIYIKKVTFPSTTMSFPNKEWNLRPSPHLAPSPHAWCITTFHKWPAEWSFSAIPLEPGHYLSALRKAWLLQGHFKTSSACCASAPSARLVNMLIQVLWKNIGMYILVWNTVKKVQSATPSRWSHPIQFGEPLSAWDAVGEWSHRSHPWTYQKPLGRRYRFKHIFW